MKPQYFIVKRDGKNPLWNKYILWLNETYGQSWSGRSCTFYGYDGGQFYNGTNARNTSKKFQNNPTQLTLEEWHKLFIENDFVLPENWCVKCTEENYNVLQEWFTNKTGCARTDKDRNSYWHFPLVKNWICTQFIVNSGYTEITFDQFKKYVLNMTTLKVGDKVPYIPKGTKIYDYNLRPYHLMCCDLSIHKEITIVKNEFFSWGSETSWFKISDFIKKTIGYKCPMNLFGGKVKKGDIFDKQTSSGLQWYSYNCSYAVAKEIVESWEPVFEQEIKTISINSQFDVVVNLNNKQAYYKTENITEAIKEFFSKIPLNGKYGKYTYQIEDIIFKQTGCEHKTTKLSDWKKIYNLIQ